MNFSILRFDAIDSTNTEALKQARQGANEGLCVIARQQTAGRGRQGRSWISPSDAGLFASIVLLPTLDARKLPLITLATAVAVFDTLTGLGIKPDIKWPNDVLVNEKKICGILAETTDTSSGLAIIVGIGINVTSNSFPPELGETATSLEGELNIPVTFSDLESILLRQFDNWYSKLCDEDGPTVVVTGWSKRSSYANGKNVRVSFTGGSVSGVTNGLEPDGALRMVTADGAIHIVHAGDVERLRPSD
jgi:BirA family biotin operon repressor/biotin-[acetyl-CoA-carboxylase] ligase